MTSISILVDPMNSMRRISVEPSSGRSPSQTPFRGPKTISSVVSQQGVAGCEGGCSSVLLEGPSPTCTTYSTLQNSNRDVISVVGVNHQGSSRNREGQQAARLRYTSWRLKSSQRLFTCSTFDGAHVLSVRACDDLLQGCNIAICSSVHQDAAPDR